MTKKTSFLLHKEYFEFLDKLSDEDFVAFVKAMRDFVFDEEEPSLPAHLSFPFIFVKNRLQSEKTKWEETKEARAEAGKKGAKKRWNLNAQIANDSKNSNAINRIDDIANNSNAINANGKNSKAINEMAKIANDSKNAVSVSVSVSESVSVNNKYSSPSDDGGPTDLPPDQDDAEKRKEQKGERKQRAKENEERFNRFWAAYPKREDKKNAIRAWNKLSVTDQILDEILSALEKQKASAQWNDRKYIPHPSTWLNGERWKDETEPTTGAPPGNNPLEKTQNHKGRHKLDPNKNYDFVDAELLAIIESMEAE